MWRNYCAHDKCGCTDKQTNRHRKCTATLGPAGHAQSATRASKNCHNIIILLSPRLTVAYFSYSCSSHPIDGFHSIFSRQLGITSPGSLLIGQYPHHMTLWPSSFYMERCYGIRLYVSHLMFCAVSWDGGGSRDGISCVEEPRTHLNRQRGYNVWVSTRTF